MDIETKIRLNNIKASIEHDGSDQPADAVKFIIDLLHAEQSENARLQSIIDEANAQQVPDAIKLLQRVAASTTESIASKQSVDRDTIINVLLSIGNMSEGIIADAIIGAISKMETTKLTEAAEPYDVPADCLSPTVASSRRYGFPAAQPSPAVAVPDYDNMDALINELREHIAQPPHLQSEEFIKGCLHALDTLKCRTKTKRDWLLRTQSPRITEQDAREKVSYPSGTGELIVSDPDVNDVVIVRDESGEYMRVSVFAITKLNAKTEGEQNGK